MPKNGNSDGNSPCNSVETQSANELERLSRPLQKSYFRRLWTVRVGAFLAGLCGGVGCAVIVYPISADARIGGFPIPAYAFQRLDQSEGWIDFVSPMSFPLLVIDFFLGFYFFWWMVLRFGRRFGSSSGRKRDITDFGEAER